MLTITKRRKSGGRGGRRAVIALMAAALTVFALAGIGTALIGRGTPATSATAGAPNDPLVNGLSRSVPQRIRIPAIGVASNLVTLGLQDDKTTMQLPPAAGQIGWYTGSPTPGQSGASIIAGYIKDGRLPGVLTDLAQLKPGQNITVDRQDGDVVVFTVDKIKQYPHGTFPTSEVYASSGRPALRIVTVGGVLRPGDEPGNVVVYAHMTAVHAAAPEHHQS